MSAIRLQRSDIGKRQVQIKRLFSQYTDPSSPNVFLAGHAKQVILGTGSYAAGGNPRNVRQRTKVDDVFLNYFEVWDDLAVKNRFYLNKSYLHLDHVDSLGVTETELLALHCDPDTPDSEQNSQYKKGPHLHVSVATHEFSKSHIALCLQQLNETLSDFSSFSKALSLAVDLVHDEFLVRLS